MKTISNEIELEKVMNSIENDIRKSLEIFDDYAVFRIEKKEAVAHQDFEKAAADIEAFIDTLEKMLQLCDIWTERIKGGCESDDMKPSGYPSDGNRIFA